MDNAQKAIMIGVGLFITIIIIAAVMLITGIGTSLVNKGTNKAGNVAAQLDQTELEQYDNTKMSGAQVLSAVKKYWTDSNIVIYVESGNKSVCTTSNAVNNSLNLEGNFWTGASGVIEKVDDHNKDSISNYTTVGNEKYISPSANYSANLIKISGNTVGVKFLKK